MLNMIEHFCGAGALFEIPENIRTFNQLTHLFNFTHGRAHGNQEKLRARVPPQYDEDGHYGVEWSDWTSIGKVFFAHPHLYVKRDRTLPLGFGCAP